MSAAKVLVVEDDDDLRTALALRLQSFGYVVVQARDGYTAVSVARQELPDVVLLDLGLPSGDGVSVLERYQRIASCRDIPVVVLTGRDPEKAASDVAPFQVSAVLTKPADNLDLAKSLAAALGTRTLARESESGAESAGGPHGGSSSRSTVLVVEDDDDLRHGLALRIEAFGYAVAQAGDGYSAVSVAMRERPDVVLLDLGLPGGDGVSVLQRFAHMGPLSGIPVVVLTGRERERAVAEVSQFHVWAVLEKPADKAQLAEALASALRGPRAGPVSGEA